MIKPIMSNNTMKHNEVVKNEVFNKPEKRVVLNEKDVKKQKVTKKIEKKEKKRREKKKFCYCVHNGYCIRIKRNYLKIIFST